MEADDLMAEVVRRLGEDTKELMGTKVTPKNFLSTVAMSLHWNFGVRIDRIDYDQWAIVSAVDYISDRLISVHCDRAEDGLAAIWLWAAENINAESDEDE